MSKENSILKNTSFLMAGTFLQRVLAFFTTVIITRSLGPENYGQLTFVIALVTIFSVFWEFGLNTVFVLDVSRNKDLTADYSGNVIVLKSVLLLLIFPGILAYIKLLNYDDIIVEAVIYFTIGTYIFSLTGVTESVFSAWKRLDYSAILNVSRAVLLLALILVTVNFKISLFGVVLCYLLSFLGVFFLALVFMHRTFVLPSFKSLSLMNLWKLVVKSWPYVLTSVVSIILFRIDHLMLSKMSGNYQLGLYGAAYTIMEIIVAFLPMLIMRSAFPVLCELYRKDIDGMVSLYNKLLRIFIFFGLPISCGAILLGNEIIAAIFGEEYYEAGILLSALGGSIVVFFLTNLMGWTITAMDRQKLILLFGVISMVSNIFINFFAIPAMGALGAALATLASEMIQLLFMTVLIRKIVNGRFQAGHLKIVISTAIMLLVIIFLKRLNFSNDLVKLLIIVLTAGLAYLMSSVLLKVFDYQDMRKMLKAW